MISDFLYRNFYNYECYKNMKPDSNQLVCYYGIAKTHKFENLKGIIVTNLRVRSIISQTGTFTYNECKGISDCLRPLCRNHYSIDNTQNFLDIFCYLQLTRWHRRWQISYDFESSFTNFPIEETINYIIEQIYVHKKLTPICLKLIFRWLSLKFKFNILNSKF